MRSSGPLAPCLRPTPTVTSSWRPYTWGRWHWTPVGWSWIAYEPWGWLPADPSRGLQISEFALLEGAARQQYRYELLLTQVEARRSVVQGAVTIDLVGEQDGGQVVLPLTEMEPQTDYPLKYRFRYFQDFSGTLALPEGFEPQRVVVTVTRQGSREANLQRTFDWDIEVADA